MYPKRYPVAYLVAALIVAAGIAGTSDYETAKMEEKAYCEAVSKGEWPDFDHIFDEVCAKEYGLTIERPYRFREYGESDPR